MAVPHVIIFPLPLQGPVNCMLKLAELLCLQQEIRVSFVNTEYIQQRLLNFTDVQIRFQKYPKFKFVTVPDGLPEDNPRTGDQIRKIIEGVEEVSSPLFREMVTTCAPTCLIVDVRYVATDIPSDLLVQIEDVTFHLHKYHLLSRSGKMNRIIYESRDAELKKISLNELPGGLEASELAAKFCYGIAIDLSATNISGLRCAAEYLEMTEDLKEDNIFKSEAFLSYVVLSSWRDSILVLKSCKNLIMCFHGEKQDKKQ